MAEQHDALGGLQRGFVLALLMIFALLAVPLRFYVQPLIIMSAIPFRLIGAVWGTSSWASTWSIMSIFGLVALTAVVVNDEQIMVDFVNRAWRVHAHVGRLAQQAGGRPAGLRNGRPRPRSVEGRRPPLPAHPANLVADHLLRPRADVEQEPPDLLHMVPMALSIGFAVLFPTHIAVDLGATAVHHPQTTLAGRCGGSSGAPSPGRATATVPQRAWAGRRSEPMNRPPGGQTRLGAAVRESTTPQASRPGVLSGRGRSGEAHRPGSSSRRAPVPLDFRRGEQGGPGPG